MLLVITILCGVFVGWQAGRDDWVSALPLAVFVAAALTLAGYVQYAVKNWRGMLARFLSRDSRQMQRETIMMLGWSLALRLILMGAVAVLAYWTSIVVHG